MKKFLLSSMLLLCVAAATGQAPCPTDVKRNNGNSCTSGGTGGQVEVEFPSTPNAQLQIALIVNSQGTATVIETTKAVSTRAGKTYITWCFETDNLGPISQGSVQYQFYIDANNNNQQDLPGESSTLCTQSTLPVSLVNFNAVNKAGKVTISWNTLFEVNNDGFEVERKTGAGAYQKIAFLKSKTPAGTGDAYAYSFEDNADLPKGVTYYRLRQIDLDGRVSYSEIRAVRTGNGVLVLAVYPNPSRGAASVTIPAGLGKVDITLSDFTGKVLQQWNAVTTTNHTLTNLKPGMYLLRVNVQSTGETMFERITVQ
ncbi:MAG: T9SS type A sorting domain-containing protein [Lacibacter sp.]